MVENRTKGQSNYKLKDEDIANIKFFKKHGASDLDIMDIFKISRAAIHYWVNDDYRETVSKRKYKYKPIKKEVRNLRHRRITKKKKKLQGDEFRKWRQSCSERYYLKNRKKILQRSRDWAKKAYAKNPEEYKEKREKWKKENPEKYKETYKNYEKRNKKKISARKRECYYRDKKLKQKNEN